MPERRCAWSGLLQLNEHLEKQLAREERENARIENCVFVIKEELAVCLCDYSRQFEPFAGRKQSRNANELWDYWRAQNSIDHRIVIAVKNRNPNVRVRRWNPFVLRPENKQLGLPWKNASMVA